MKIKLMALVLVALLSGAYLALQPARVTHADAAASCTLEYFRADVAQGPNKGLSLLGKLKLDIDSNGGVTGALTPDGGGADIKVAGQVNGRAINLAFEVAQADQPTRYIFGVGSAWNDVKDCNSVLGGPFAGPDSGDLGDWLSCVRRGAKDDCARGG
ncbi:MAG: hypothetical protein KF716_18770 [Anaerolineae bacterium]|nr:hypothetical protein [Anaerolineae bacterium]